MSAAPDERAPPKRASASVRFIEQFLQQGQQGRLTGLLLGQLDAFNRIATTFDHDRCEAFCAEYAEQLRDSFPPRTPIIRLAERRFAVLLALDSMSAVMDAAVALTEEHPPHLRVDDDTFLVDLTLGIAVHPSHAEDAASLFRRAELALKEAKENELAFDIYRPDATQQQAALWKFESELEQAVQRGELEVYFQPKVAVAEHRVSGVEALVRWRMKSGRFVPATDFIPLSERTGSIVPITWLVFDRTVEAAAEWAAGRARREKQNPQHGDDKPANGGQAFSIAVNLSPQVLTHAEFLPRLKALKAALREHGMGLTIELTEDSLVQSDATSLDCLERIRKLDIDLAIDDFGKGYSSLTYLKEIPATEIKIDKRFIGTIALDEKNRHIVSTVITLAHALGMRVVAEGVDSAEGLAVIAELGCELALGFFIGRPMRGDLIPEWIDDYTAAPTSTRASRAQVWPVHAEL